MIELKKDDLLKTNGGGLSLGMGCFLVGLGVFIVGIFDGFTRPIKCNF